jgi:SanA protein
MVFAIVLILGVATNIYIRYSTKACITTDATLVKRGKVAIIFGAGLTKEAKPSLTLANRLDAGIDLYKQGIVSKLLLSGDNRKVGYDELTAMATYCMQRNVDTGSIFIDYAGFDSYSTIYRAKAVFNIDSAVLVSQKYHLPRCIYISQCLGLHCQGYIAKPVSRFSSRKSRLREYAASIKALIDCVRNRLPHFLGKQINIDGKSNFALQPVVRLKN